ncbi:MAG: alkaline phosphatase family protein [Candidatus Omnitrophica bacterium]|nr:alkaline phosphatase family protein [Candidatus Omnitrophota bacterium]
MFSRKHYVLCIIGVGMFVLFLLKLYHTISFRWVRPRNVILIGWDGVSRERLMVLLSQGKLPNVGRLIKQGKLIDIDIQRRTSTKPGWSEILSGYGPEVTGIHDNYWYRAIPNGLTVFERLENFFGKNNIVTMAFIGKSNNLGARAPKAHCSFEDLLPEEKDLLRQISPDKKARLEYMFEVDSAGREYINFPGEPFANAKKSMDIFRDGLGDYPFVERDAIKALDLMHRRRFFLFIHFQDPDNLGAQFGEQSREVTDSLIALDGALGRIIKKLHDCGIYQTTLVYLTSDHGFNKNTNMHSDAPFVFLATNDRHLIRKGRRIDIAPTILDAFGVNLKTLAPTLEGWPLNFVKPDEYSKRSY